MMPRTLFSAEHDIFREAVRRFVETELAPITPNGSARASCRGRPGGRLGEENGGFGIMMTKLAQERLSRAVRSATAARGRDPVDRRQG